MAGVRLLRSGTPLVCLEDSPSQSYFGDPIEVFGTLRGHLFQPAKSMSLRVLGKQDRPSDTERQLRWKSEG